MLLLNYIYEKKGLHCHKLCVLAGDGIEYAGGLYLINYI
jgi:hypothetical protein